MTPTSLYDDGKIACDDTGLVIKRYYPWGAKRVPYTAIRSITLLPIKIRRWRLWGSGDFRHWWNLDLNRPHKTLALDLDTGHWIHPTITPDNADAVEHPSAAPHPALFLKPGARDRSDSRSSKDGRTCDRGALMEQSGRNRRQRTANPATRKAARLVAHGCR